MTPILLDGSHGEGGGALVRVALAMSALTQQPMRVSTVRGGQRYQGLHAEDLVLIRALKESTKAETTGAEAGSQEFSFLPTRRPRSLDRAVAAVDGQGNPHANALILLSTLAPVLARSGGYSRLDITGETYGSNALGFDGFAGPTLTTLGKLGMYAEVEQIEAGFGVGSQGRVIAEIEPSALTGIDWTERGELRSITATIAIGELGDPVADRGRSFLGRLAHSAGLSIECEVVRLESRSPGAHLTLFAEFERGVGGSQSMGMRGLRMETVVQTGFCKFMDWLRSEATVDEHLADQIIVTACIAEGPTTFKVNRITSRLLTSIWVIKQFLPIHITVKGKEGERGTISIRR
jgi:RNA 3'-terminal phosphate cyclase (ATP)